MGNLRQMHPAVDDLGLQSAACSCKPANRAETRVAHHVLFHWFAQPTKGPPMADDNDQLPSIDPAQLAAVTGGAGDSSEAIMALLTSLASSIKDLGQKRNSNPFGDMMPMIMMMMMNRPQPQQAVVAAPTVGPDGAPIGPGGWERVA
jgi:hypothetical protein